MITAPLVQVLQVLHLDLGLNISRLLLDSAPLSQLGKCPVSEWQNFPFPFVWDSCPVHSSVDWARCWNWKSPFFSWVLNHTTATCFGTFSFLYIPPRTTLPKNATSGFRSLLSWIYVKYLGSGQPSWYFPLDLNFLINKIPKFISWMTSRVFYNSKSIMLFYS